MLYSFEFVRDCGIYNLNRDVLDFFQASITATRYSAELMSIQLQNVVNDSTNLDSKFKAVFVELNKRDIDKSSVYNFLTNNNNIIQLLSNPEYKLLSLSSPAYDKIYFKIKDLFLFLWTSTISTQTCSNNYGSLSQHYMDHDTANSSRRRICPFCGLFKLDDPNEKRNEYDHYLDKGTYPYLSLNFHNLVPMCGKCNKRPNKGTQNIIFDTKGNRRIAYYPYAAVSPFEIGVRCKNLFMPNEKWQLSCSAPSPDIGFKTWKTVFKIDFRYGNYIKSEYSFWLEGFTDYCKDNLPMTVTDFRDRIKSYINEVLRFVKNDLGYNLHLKFWDYICTVPDSDQQLIINWMDEKSKF